MLHTSDSRSVNGRTDNSFSHLVDECVANFGIPPSESENVSNALDIQESVQHYVRCHIFCLISTTLFLNKSTSMVSYKYLPLLRIFSKIKSYNWGLACLA
ncbi:hypothetical protein AHAS_Ahas15G0282300 [Arachis hypogaea]